MANVATTQTLIREIILLLRTRGLRFANLTSNDIFGVHHQLKDTSLPDGEFDGYICIGYKNADLTALDEKAHGAGPHPLVPDPTRQ